MWYSKDLTIFGLLCLPAMQGSPRNPTRANQSSTSGLNWFPDLALPLNLQSNAEDLRRHVRSRNAFVQKG